jgi:hypothetical protein
MRCALGMLDLKEHDEFVHLENNLIKTRKLLRKKVLTVVYSKNKKNEYIIITAYFNN